MELANTLLIFFGVCGGGGGVPNPFRKCGVLMFDGIKRRAGGRLLWEV